MKDTQTESKGMEKYFMQMETKKKKMGYQYFYQTKKKDFKNKGYKKRQRRTQQFHFRLFTEEIQNTNSKKHMHLFVHCIIFLKFLKILFIYF